MRFFNQIVAQNR